MPTVSRRSALSGSTLAPIALIDGAALTTLRTATSAAVADHLAPAGVDHLVVLGSAPQACGPVAAMRAIRPTGRVTIVARDQNRAGALTSRVQASGPDARVGTAQDVHHAQLIVCATTATPLLDRRLVPDDACVVAVGSHAADPRELDSTLEGAPNSWWRTPLSRCARPVT